MPRKAAREGRMLLGWEPGRSGWCTRCDTGSLERRKEPEMPKVKRRVLGPVLAGVAIAFALLALAPTAALAKGASAGTIDGGEPGSGTDLGTLADLSGLFPAMFGQSPDPMLDASPTPAERLGPRYTITWTIPDGIGTAKKVRQDVYPYAAGAPVTYTKPGQP